MPVSDEQLVQLLQLGFDLETSKQALSNTSTVEEAIDRILSGSQPRNAAIEPAVDRTSTPDLGEPVPSEEDDSNNTTITSRYDTSSKDMEYRQTALKLAADLKRSKAMEKEAHRRALQQIQEDRETQKLRSRQKVAKLDDARDSMNNTTPKAIAAISEEQTNAASEKAQLKLAKLSEREARRRVLENIAEDKRNRKRDEAPKALATPQSTNSKPEEAFISPAIDNATIQFRFPDGRVDRKLFSADDTIELILTYASSRMAAAGGTPELGFIQMSSTFPRKTYTIADAATTARDAGFISNCTLNVSIIPTVIPQSAAPNVNQPISSVTDIDMDSTTNLDMDDSESDNHSDPDIDMIPARPPVPRGGRQARATGGRRPQGRPPRGQRGSQRRGGSIFRGQGRTLADEAAFSDVRNAPNSGTQLANHEIEDREAIRQLRSRLHGHTGKVVEDKTQISVKRLQRELPTLRDMCAATVAVFLTSPTKERYACLKSLSQLSPEVAELLLSHLIKIGRLDRTVLERIANHCYLQNCVFNAYPYATDSLLEELCISASAISIKKLSLSGCDIITNAGIQKIHNLRQLEFLDLSNCKATDKSLEALSKLPCLLHLYLSKTKITSRGLNSFADTALCRDNIQTLVLNGCPGISSPNIFVLLSNFPNLLHLNLSSLDLPSPCDVPSGPILKHLQALDISNTGVGDTEVRRIFSRMKELLEIKLTGCRAISVPALSFLGKELSKLEDVKFPNQNQDLNGCLFHYSRLNLTHLNLGNFKEIDDSGMEHIANMRQLRFLSLEGSKITDNGLSFLTEMEHLEQLYLDRTAVTDEGIKSIRNFPSIIALSLSHTAITDTTLRLIGDPIATRFTRDIRSLNVASCQVTNNGVKSLKHMINLHSLNLDRTRANARCKHYLEGLEHLLPFRVPAAVSEDESSDSESTANEMVFL